ncbi:hypothetical protein [Rhodococcus phenolicus]|uniref:hypothetical protein n=1 Tax=Rhodococcus phenolicus TaxID=263849 RepID=UPI0008374D43|nr:hypothetical protein [Rhodococcus phenolicus]
MFDRRHLFARPLPQHNVWLDVSDLAADPDALDTAVDRVLQQPRLRLAGASCALGARDEGARCAEACIDRAIAAMAQIRRRRGVTLTQLAVAVAGGTDPGVSIESCLDDACARHRYPRPTTTLLFRTAPAGRYPAGTLGAVPGAAVELS